MEDPQLNPVTVTKASALETVIARLLHFENKTSLDQLSSNTYQTNKEVYKLLTGREWKSKVIPAPILN